MTRGSHEIEPSLWEIFKIGRGYVVALKPVGISLIIAMPDGRR